MKKKSRLLALLLTLAMVLTYMPAMAFAGNGGVEDGETTDLGDCRICFAGDWKYDWAHIYSVGGSESILDADELDISVVDNKGNPIDPEYYELTLERTWWDDGDHRVQVEPPLGIQPEDKQLGFSEYVATARAKEESDCTGKTEASFIIRDKYSLEYVGSNLSFADTVRTGWRGSDRYWIQKGSEVPELSVRTADKPNENLSANYYDVYYYKTAHDIDEDDPSKGYDHYIVIDDDYILPGFPTEAGQYFVYVEGKAGYYGGNIALIDIVDYTPISIAQDEKDLWSDGTKELTLDFPDSVSGDMSLTVTPNDERGEREPVDLSTEDYNYNSSTKKILLDGSKIINKTGNCWADLRVEFKDGEVTTAVGTTSFEIREARYDYDLPQNVKLLPGWEGEIDGIIEAYIENKEYPEGRYFRLDVSDVVIKSQSEDKTVIELTGPDDEGNWHYEAMDYGNAGLQVTYIDYDGSSVTYDINVDVEGEIYDTYFKPESGVYTGLPGTSIVLKAFAKKDWCHEDDDRGRTFKGIGYKWEITEGNEFATIEQDASDPGRAVLSFKPLKAGWDSIGEEVIVKISVYDSGDPNKRVKAAFEEDFQVEDEYCCIYPATADENLEVGGSFTIKPELRRYRLGSANYTVVDGATFNVEGYNDDPDDPDMQVSKSGGTYTIKRISEWDFDFIIRAEWQEDGDERDSEQWYHFNEMRSDEDADKAMMVQNLISSLDAVNPDKAAIARARAEYDKLSDEDKDAIDTTRLTLAEKKQAEIEKAEKDAAEKAAAEEAAKAAAAAEAARQGTPDSTVPKVTASKPKAAKKALTVKWKKLNKKAKKKATNIEIWACPNKSFAAADTKIVTVGKGKSSKKVTGLTAKTKYYVKVRAIKNAGGVKYVGKWSKVKSMKTK